MGWTPSPGPWVLLIAALAGGCSGTSSPELGAAAPGSGGNDPVVVSGSGAGTSAGASSGGTARGGESNSAGGSAGGAALGGAGAGGGGSNVVAGSAGEALGGASAGASGASASSLPTPPGDPNIPKPAGAPGGLTILSWAGFKAAVSYTFDDTNSSQIQNFDALNALGVRFTFYLITGKSELKDPVWKRALALGHELGNHTKSHQQTDDGSDTDAGAKALQDTFGIDVWTMAAPYGSSVYADIAKTRFLINRGVANALIAPNDTSNPFNLPCYIPPTGASTAEMDSQITSAQSEGKWRVVLVHGFAGGTDGAYQPVSLQAFLDSVQHSKALGNVWIDSVVNVASYWRAQKLLAGVAPTTVGSQTTWSWHLPDHFPPRKVLRVKVSGGTPQQNGQPLAWNPHGYYEVALDAGSLTLAP